MKYSTAVAFEFEADGIMTAQKVSAAMARGAEAAVGGGTVRQVGCLELAPEDTLDARRDAAAEEAANLALLDDN